MILVVEHEVMVRYAVSLHLRDSGFVVVEAGTTDEAVRLIGAGERVDLVFSDINMPGAMDGNGLARWILQAHPSIKVITTSGGRRASNGSSIFVAKPYDHAELVRLIERLLE